MSNHLEMTKGILKMQVFNVSVFIDMTQNVILYFTGKKLNKGNLIHLKLIGPPYTHAEKDVKSLNQYSIVFIILF